MNFVLVSGTITTAGFRFPLRVPEGKRKICVRQILYIVDNAQVASYSVRTDLVAGGVLGIIGDSKDVSSPNLVHNINFSAGDNFLFQVYDLTNGALQNAGRLSLFLEFV